MSETRTFEVRLPSGKEFTDEEVSILHMACEALVGMHCCSEGDPPAQVRAMAKEGWQVRTHLVWIARAERDREYEEAVADTRGEALCRLCQMTGLHSVEGCP